MTKRRLLIFASGSAEGGGSGFENLHVSTKKGMLDAEIIGVVSNREHGGVRERADRLGVPFYHFGPPWSYAGYEVLKRELKPDFCAASGWLKPIRALDPRTTCNIHPGLLPKFGGSGMYGHHVHEAVMAAYGRGEITHTAVCMHFVTEEYDKGPCFFKMRVKINENDTPESLGARVNEGEHFWQPRITNMVVQGAIQWDGVDPKSLVVPPLYQIENHELDGIV